MSETNRMVPSNVYDNAGQWVMPFTAGDFLTNDDNSYYNYAIDDDLAKTRGRGHIKTTSLEISGVIQIPNGWIATGSFLDVRLSSGAVVTPSPPTYTMYRLFTTQTGGTIPDAIHLYYYGTEAINTENTFYGGVTVTGVYNEALLIDVNLASTTHYVGGGYILLTAPS